LNNNQDDESKIINLEWSNMKVHVKRSSLKFLFSIVTDQDFFLYFSRLENDQTFFHTPSGTLWFQLTSLSIFALSTLPLPSIGGGCRVSPGSGPRQSWARWPLPPHFVHIVVLVMVWFSGFNHARSLQTPSSNHQQTTWYFCCSMLGSDALRGLNLMSTTQHKHTLASDPPWASRSAWPAPSTAASWDHCLPLVARCPARDISTCNHPRWLAQKQNRVEVSCSLKEAGWFDWLVNCNGLA